MIPMIKLKKTFFSFRRYKNDGTVSTNGRLYSLLSSLNLSERMLTIQYLFA